MRHFPAPQMAVTVALLAPASHASTSVCHRRRAAHSCAPQKLLATVIRSITAAEHVDGEQFSGAGSSANGLGKGRASRVHAAKATHQSASACSQEAPMSSLALICVWPANITAVGAKERGVGGDHQVVHQTALASPAECGELVAVTRTRWPECSLKRESACQHTPSCRRLRIVELIHGSD